MQTRIRFHGLRKALDGGLLSPSVREATERLAFQLPRATGPCAKLLGSVIFIEDDVWRFRSGADARRFAELLQDYFRNFDPNYRIKSLDEQEIQFLRARAM